MRGTIVLLLVIFISGCMTQPRALTPQEIALQQSMLERFSNLQNFQNAPQMQPATIAPTQQTVSISEDSLLEKIEALPKLGAPVSIVQKKDGFDINGRRHIDPEGKIVAYGFDSTYGDVTYVAQTGQDTYILKFLRVGSGKEPIAIAYAEKNGYSWSIQTVTGRKLNGDSLTPFSKGFLVARDTTGFIYEPGNGIVSIAAPDGFHIANFQNGEVQRTGYILLERDAVDEGNQVGSLVSSVKALGATLGVNKKEDYQILNYKTGDIIPINISVEGKNVSLYSKCKKKNSFVNECQNIDFFESLYDQYGMPNGGHYYWAISWFGTDDGTLLITKEGTKVFVTEIEAEKSYLAFQRTLGVNFIEATRTGEGKILLKAKLGISTDQIDDVQQFVASSEPITK